MEKKLLTREGLVLRLQVLKDALCIGKAFDRECNCANIGEPGATGCIEIGESIAILEAMTDSEFEYIKWVHATDNAFTRD